MSRSVGIIYAIAGTVMAASMLVIAGATLWLGAGDSPAGADIFGIGAPAGIATNAVVPAGALQPGEQIVRSEVVQTAGGPVEYLYVASPATAHGHDDDDDEHEKREHEQRKPEKREDSGRLREARR